MPRLFRYSWMCCVICYLFICFSHPIDPFWKIAPPSQIKKIIQKLKCFFFLSLCLMCVQQEDSKERRTMKSTHHDVTGVWRYRRPLAVHHRESVNRRDDRITKPRKNSQPAAALFFVQKAGDVTVDIGGYKSLPIQREESSKEPRNGSLIAVQPQRKENKRRTERSERKR